MREYASSRVREHQLAMDSTLCLAAVAAAGASAACDSAWAAALFLTAACALLYLRVVRLERLVATGASESRPNVSQSTFEEPIEQRWETPFIASETDHAGPTYIDAESEPWPLASIEAYLIDLDGTIYSPSGPIDGAAEFYAAVLRGRPHVFLSNTGAKGADGVRSKLAKNGIIMGPDSQSKHIYTAAQAQCRFMIDTIPKGARVFVIAGGDADGPGSYWMKLLHDESAELVSSWALRTHLSDATAREWAAAAAAGRPVFVVLFSDGSISAVSDPNTGEAGFADWSYDVIKKTSFVLSHGAHLVATAEDAFNPSTDNMPLPGPGMFCAMFRALLHPLGSDRLHICGKGGGAGREYMLEHALRMLRAQGFAGERASVLIVGDRFDTDIRAGAAAGVRTCLVESGCHTAELQAHFADAPADFAAASIAALIPPHRRAPGEWRKYSFDHCHPPAGPPSVARQLSDRPSASLRAWQLGHGNLVYSAAGRDGGATAAPLLLMLRSFFDEVARAADAAGGGGSGPPTIAAADALDAMRALGVSPPRVADERPLHRFPFDLTGGTGRSRVTYAQLCRAVQRALESDGAARCGRSSAWGSVFEPPPRLARSESAARAARTWSGRAPGQGPPGPAEAPAELQARGLLLSSRGLGGGAALPPVASDTALETLEWRAHAAAPSLQRRSSVSLTHGKASQLVHALVDRRFLYLGKE